MERLEYVLKITVLVNETEYLKSVSLQRWNRGVGGVGEADTIGTTKELNAVSKIPFEFVIQLKLFFT